MAKKQPDQKLRDIVLYTNLDVLTHKKGLAEGEEDFEWFSWGMARPPKDFDDGCRIYFAHDGYVRGYFKCHDFNPDSKDCTVVWHKRTWRDVKKDIDTKPFQGFKYKWWK